MRQNLKNDINLVRTDEIECFGCFKTKFIVLAGGDSSQDEAEEEAKAITVKIYTHTHSLSYTHTNS